MADTDGPSGAMRRPGSPLWYGRKIDCPTKLLRARSIPSRDSTVGARPSEVRSCASKRAGISSHGARTNIGRSEEHTSELQSLMRISYAVFCLKKQKNIKNNT